MFAAWGPQAGLMSKLFGTRFEHAYFGNSTHIGTNQIHDVRKDFEIEYSASEFNDVKHNASQELVSLTVQFIRISVRIHV